MSHRKTTIGRAEVAFRLRGEGRSVEEIGRLMHATAKTVRFLLSVADSSRIEGPITGPTPKERKCVACGETKPLVEFYRCDKGYYKHRCRPCQLVRFAQNYQARAARYTRVEPPTLAIDVSWPKEAQLWALGRAPSAEAVLRELSEVRT
jgi:hypothetical protein